MADCFSMQRIGKKERSKVPKMEIKYFNTNLCCFFFIFFPLSLTLFLTHCLLVSSADKFAISLDPDQAPQNVGSDLDPNGLTL